MTPNLKEASALLGGVLLETFDDMRFAAKSIYEFGPRLDSTYVKLLCSLFYFIFLLC